MTLHLRKTFAALGLAAAAALAGCSDAVSPTSAERPRLQAGVSGPAVEAIAKYKGGPPSMTIAWAKKWIGPEGGTIEFLGFGVTVPAGAVDRVTQFSIRLPVDPKNNEFVMAEFGPHGQQFAVPVTLRLPLTGTTSEGTPARILWWNGEIWEPMSTTQMEGYLLAPTTHFSTYGTEDTQRGFTLAGG
jgi:hypothetical protein